MKFDAERVFYFCGDNPDAAMPDQTVGQERTAAGPSRKSAET